jgi:uncharacterized protein
MNKFILILTWFSLLLFSFTSSSGSFYPEKPSAWVNDYADLLTEEQERSLNAKLSSFQDTTGTQIFIVTSNDHEGAPISLMANEIGEKWGVGGKEKDNGILILIYPDQNEIFIAPGYGVEEYITDAISRRIIEKEIVPSFRESDFHGGLDKATDVIMNLLSGVFTVEQYDKGSEDGGALVGLFLFFLITFLLFSRMKGRKSYSVGKNVPFWVALAMLSGSGSGRSGGFGGFKSGGGGFGGGGFSGGMGGSFGGGGAGGRW